MIEVKFTGKVISNKVETFTSKSTGNSFTKRMIVLENKTESGYTDTLEVICFGENVDKCENIAEGMTISMRGSVSSHEYNGRYFTQVNLYDWGTEKGVEAPKPVVDAPKADKKPTQKPQEFAPQSENDGLPF